MNPPFGNDPQEPFYTVSEAAALLNINLRRLEHAIRTGVVKSYTSLARHPLVRISEILAAIDVSPNGGQR